MFFFTQQDPNFRIKGSRDPLGFQPIWQQLGRNVVKYLSTVSTNIKDFQVLSYAWYFYGDRDPKDFLNFFYKFEQACGFARGIYFGKEASFNGIDFVRKNMDAELFTFSTQSRHTLLSNQKSYGIYGKYNRPFTEMQIKEQKNFSEVMENSLKEKIDFESLRQKVNFLLEKGAVTMTKSDLEIFADILKTLATPERIFYQKHILEANEQHVQNELFQLFVKQPNLVSADFNLYGFIETLLKEDISEQLQQYLIKIKNTEKVLVPYALLFKKVQSASVWPKNEIENISIFDSFPKSISYSFDDTLIEELSEIFTAHPDKYKIVEKAIGRNKEVSDRRGNAAWMKLENEKVIVSYQDGAKDIQGFESEKNYENNYFIPSYISLFKQIMPQV